MSESDEDLEKVAVSFGLFVLCIAFIVGFALAWNLRGEEEYIEKLKFCHDRMKNKDVLAAWKMHYCKAPVLDAIDPITGRPVAGIVEVE